MPLENSKSSTTEVLNLMFNLNVTMQGHKMDWILIVPFWSKLDDCSHGLNSVKN